MTLLYRLCDWVGTWLHRACNALGNLTGTVILVPHATAVGNCAEQIYYGMLKACRERKKLAIFFPYSLPWPLQLRLTNIELVALESEYRAFSHGSPLYVLGSVLITLYFAFFRAVDLVLHRISRYRLMSSFTLPMIGHTTLWQPEERMPEFSWDIVDKYDWPKQLQTRIHLSIATPKRLLAEQQRLQMGLPRDAWFVCLHVREGGFHNEQTVYERNASIMNYIGAIEEITARGGWVVRMGDATMTRLPSMERVIDYPFTDAKSDLMDMYLISQCRAYVGMASGIFDVAILLQRPIILTNMVSWLFGFPQKSGDIGLLKHIYSKSRARFLSIREWLLEEVDAQSLLELGNDYEFYENTPEELKGVVKEFFDRGANWSATPLQCQFNELRIRLGRQLLSKPIDLNDRISDLHQRYRFASRLDSATGVISDDFLRKNWNLTPDNEPCEIAGAANKHGLPFLSGSTVYCG